MQCCPGLTRFFLTLATLGLFAGVVALSQTGSVTADEKEAAKKEEKMLRHVVMFKFKEESSKEDIQGVVDAFRALPDKIPEIADFEYGTDNSPEGLADGFTHCFLVSFKSEKDRDVYLPHKAHKAFVEVLKPHLDKVMVIDYWAGK